MNFSLSSLVDQLALVAVTTETVLGVATPVTVDGAAEEDELPPPPILQPAVNANTARTRRTTRALRNEFAI